MLIVMLTLTTTLSLLIAADCCHSGSMLDHKQVSITGPKAGGPPPPTVDASMIQSMLASLGAGLGGGGGTKGIEMVSMSRSLPFGDLCGIISQQRPGVDVVSRGFGAALGQMFGGDATAKVTGALQQVGGGCSWTGPCLDSQYIACSTILG